VSRALEVLESVVLSTKRSLLSSLLPIFLRVELLEVRVNEPLLGDLDEYTIGASNKVSLAIKWTVVGLLYNLDCEHNVGSRRQRIRGDDVALLGVVSPSHEGRELGFVGQDAVPVSLSIGTTKDRRHGCNVSFSQKFCE
jgi:hypothetical protein